MTVNTWGCVCTDHVAEVVDHADYLALAARLAEAERDAARYRWWRENFHTEAAERIAVNGFVSAEKFDRETDAAMAADSASVAPHDPPRCYACGWPLAKDRESGCVPGDCSYRPHRESPDYEGWRRRMDEMRAAATVTASQEAE